MDREEDLLLPLHLARGGRGPSPYVTMSLKVVLVIRRRRKAAVEEMVCSDLNELKDIDSNESFGSLKSRFEMRTVE